MQVIRITERYATKAHERMGNVSVKPILFNTEMVQAILDGRKTVTRRIVTLSNTLFPEADYYLKDLFEDGYLISKYQIGDILWVRETWGKGYEEGSYIYKASDKLAALPSFKESSRLIYHPSIHMPKEAARIFLRVTDVKAEKLQDITDEQAIKEGFEGKRCTHINRGEYGGCTDCMNTGWLEPPQLGFMESWNATVKKDCEKWSTNPYVWVISFERCEKPEGWCKQ